MAMHLARILVAVLGVGSFVGAGQLAPQASPTSQADQCVAFCRACDKCYGGDKVANATCHFLMNDSDQGSACEADCQAGRTPSAVARGGFGDNWQQLTCEQLNEGL
jgi:hypothetical protein